MSNYTPSTEEVRDAHQAGVLCMGGDTDEAREEFDRWLNEVKRQAWEEGFRSGHSLAMRRMSDEPGATGNPNPYKEEA